jgi:hypothetical protein
LKNIQHLTSFELEDWGYCWVIQQNVNENTPSIPGVLFQGYNYTWFLEWTKACEKHLREKMKKKSMINVPISQGQSLSSVPSISNQERW